MDAKGEHGLHPVKVLETLKRHLFEITDSSGGKSMETAEVCSSFVELTETVCAAVHKANAAQLISHTVELYVHACSSQDQHVRHAALENLKKLIKFLMNTHLSRVQQDLFHELKKNGSPRSLCVALDCFASLFPLSRLSKRSSYAEGLVPVLIRLIGRQDEAVHDALQEAFAKLLPTMVCSLSNSSIQNLMTAIVGRLPTGSSTYRRMASSALVLIVSHSRSPPALAEWVFNKLLSMGCSSAGNSGLLHGVLISLQHLCSKAGDINPPAAVLKQAFSFSVSCLLYCDVNVGVAALEALLSLLTSASVELQSWLVSSLPNAEIAINYWCGELPCDESDTATQDVSGVEGLELPCDTYFDSTENLAEDSKPSLVQTSEVMPNFSDKDPQPISAVAVSEISCLALQDGSDSPLQNFVKFLIDRVLSSDHVSSQSLGLACITVAIDILPTVLGSLQPIESHISSSDPKLRSRAVNLLAMVVLSNLRDQLGDFANVPSIVNIACSHLRTILEDDTPVVMKAVCEALKLCLPVLTKSTEQTIVVDIVHRLLPLCESSYWLTKVELLQTLGCLDFSSLAILEADLPKTVLNDFVFNLLGDSDHRVRKAASECLVLLARNLQLSEDPLLAYAKWQTAQLFSHLHTSMTQLSLAGIADNFAKYRPKVPLGLEQILWFLMGNISVSVDPTLQRGCLEALHLLSVQYPPPSLPDVWGCSNGAPFTLLSILDQLLTSSKLVWSVQGHCELLELTSSVFLACAFTHIDESVDKKSKSWNALSDPSLHTYATSLFQHIVKLLCVFVHIVEHRDPEVKEKRIQIPVVSPRKPGIGDALSPSKQKPISFDSFQKPPITPKDGIGQFANSPQYLKMYEACKASYTNYQVTLDPVGQDKFSRLLQVCHNSLASLLEVAMADDVGENVEEILGYIEHTVKFDPSGALLCMQQLLNALFGMNTPAQHTHVYSPYISSLPYDITPVKSPSLSSSLNEVVLSGPLSLLTLWLQPFVTTPVQSSTETKTEHRKRHGFLLRKALTVKPANSVSSIKDYIAYFEPLVVHSLNRFPYTSSTLLQQRVLFLVVQLLNLKVRYELLDCNHLFLDSVMKMVSLMESGVVRGGETLVPHLFQFLVLLAYDSSKLVTIPQVIQKCDGVMASGHNVTTFAIPALKPLVLNLFVRASKETVDLDTQREVVLNMLLRLVKYPGVIVLLTYVLDCYQRNKKEWNMVSNQIYAALLPSIGRLEILLDSKESLVVLYQLFSALDPHTINIQALLTAISKLQVLTSFQQLLRWLGMICATLQLMITIFPESTFLDGIVSLELVVPALNCDLVRVEQLPGNAEKCDKVTQLAQFLQGTLYLAASSLLQVDSKRCLEDYELLPLLNADLLLLIQSVVQGLYHNLRSTLSQLPENSTVDEVFLQLSASYPLLTIQYASLCINLHGIGLKWVSELLDKCIHNSESTSYCLIQHAILLQICGQWQAHGGSTKLAENEVNTFVTISKSEAVIRLCQESSVRHFLSSMQNQSKVVSVLCDQLEKFDVSSPTNCLYVLKLASIVQSPDTFRFICSSLVTHTASPISLASQRVAITLLDECAVEMSEDILVELMQKLKPNKDRCGELFQRLLQMSGQPSSTSTPVEISLEESATEISLHDDKLRSWYLSKIIELCVGSPASGDECASVLGQLEPEDLRHVIHCDQFSVLLLESCIERGAFLSLNKDRSSDSAHSPAHPLLEVSVDRLLKEIVTNPGCVTLSRPLIRLLAAKHQLPNCISIKDDVAKSISSLCQNSLADACAKEDPLVLQSAVDCCCLALHCSEIKYVVSEDWVCKVVLHLLKITKKVYPVRLMQVEDNQKVDTDPVDTAKKQLLTVLNVILQPTTFTEFESLRTSLESLTFAISRHPLVHNSVMIPPILLGSGAVSERILDQALMESDVLLQFMQRGNFLGWLSRSQFEERWMQLLGVINQPPPLEGTHPEEYHAFTLNVCAGLQAVTSLLLSTMLRPHLGDPTSSVAMHTPRSGDVLFLATRPGRKLAHVRKVLEYQLLLQCGVRPNLYSYYQSPLLKYVSTPHYPPMYTWNIEREVGSSNLGSGQLSVKSLWPIMLSQSLPRGYTADDTSEVDLRSCMLSLIELYTHWLNQPIHALLLQRVLQSVIMLSDLFVLSGHFEWMLKTFMEVLDSHPPEDFSVGSLAIQGILKAAAVLKSIASDAEKVSKVIEKSLSPDSAVICQTACLHGLLYLTEDSSSEIIAQTVPTLLKFITAQLQHYTRYPEVHISLVWTLAVNLLLNHSDQIKEANFTSHLLEVVLPLLSNLNISTAIFHSITFGLELLVINFSLSSQDRISIANAAASRFIKCDQSRSLAALSLLLTCMYTGEEAAPASGLAELPTDPMETALQAREQINNIMERLRHGALVDTEFLVEILPQLIVDFLPSMEVLQTVVTDFVSPHQTRPVLAGVIMAKTFSLLLAQGHESLLTEWILLSMDSFVQLQPESKAVWSIACLLTAASTLKQVQSLFPLVCYQNVLSNEEMESLLYMACHHFVEQCTEPQKQQFAKILTCSGYSVLNQMSQSFISN